MTQILFDGVEVPYVPQYHQISQYYRKASTLANLRLFRSLLRHIHPDALVTHNWGSIEWAMANWPGLVRHVHIEDGVGHLFLLCCTRCTPSPVKPYDAPTALPSTTAVYGESTLSVGSLVYQPLAPCVPPVTCACDSVTVQ